MPRRERSRERHHRRESSRTRTRSPSTAPAAQPTQPNEVGNILAQWATASTSLQQQNANLLQQMSELCLAAQRPRQDRAQISVPTFDGERSWAVFSAQFQSAAETYSWSDQQRGRRLLNALQGPAADLVLTLPPAEYQDYERLSARLREHFAPTHRCAVAEAELTRRSQRQDEQLSTYGAEVLRLTREAYPAWPEVPLQTLARNAFIAGIANPEVRRAVRMRQPANYAEALTAAIHIQAVDELEPAAKRARVGQVAADEPTPTTEPVLAVAEVRRVAPTTPSADKMQELVDQLKALVDHLARPAERARDTVTCFACNRSGHYSRDCPDNPRTANGRQGRRDDRRRRDNRHRDDDHRRRDRRRSASRPRRESNRRSDQQQGNAQ